GALTTSTRQGSRVVGFMDFIIALGWQIIPSNIRYIYILNCSQFMPTSDVTTIYFQADSGLESIFVMDSPFYASCTQQLPDKTIKTYGVTISKKQSIISINFSSSLEPNIMVSAWTASITRTQ
nr:Chain A, FIBER [Bovine adenovirus 4]4UE0_B Chain B, FIBER [Bovine adenovirus 4]4UE0_C Chain C, FIBER [Bovine adenovirus 4]